MKVRIKFAKYGAMKFIGHLDMMRFFQKAVRRAGIDIKYSEGFSPHQIMSFAAPLGVGIESMGEYFDMEVNFQASDKKFGLLPAEIKSGSIPENDKEAASSEYAILTSNIVQSLNQTMVEGVRVLSAHILPDTAKNAMASVAAASYQIHRKENFSEEKDAFGCDDLAGKLAAFYGQEKIPYTKETRKSVLELNLKSGIYVLEAGRTQAEPTSMSAVAAVFFPDNHITVPCIRMTVNASSSGNIKPSMVFEKFCDFAGIDVPASAFQITRLETYRDLAEDGEERAFVPLENSEN